MRILFLCVALIWSVFSPVAGVAQTNEDDRSYITGLIEDAINNDELTVRLINFRGALSSQATADAITIADPDGVWLRMEDLVFQWDRSALLRGRVEVETLSAGVIELIRLPSTPPGDDMPTAEATPFSLPDLPVSVEISDVRADEIILTEALLGERVRARFEGNLTLKDGVGAATVLLERIDQKTGLFDIDARFESETRQLALMVLAEEGRNGIAARLINLPDRPAVRLTVDGDAPLDNFVGDIALATDGQDRITGTVQLSTPTGTLDQAFKLDLSGDLRPMLADQYDPFFGAETVLQVEGTRFGAGGLRLSDLTVSSQQLDLQGAVELDPANWPERIELRGRLGTDDGSRVLLPLSGTPTEVAGVTLNVQYDKADGDAWTGAFDVTSLRRNGLSIDALALSGGGIIQQGAGIDRGRFTTDLSYAARGLDLNDAALNEAIGADIEGTIKLGRLEGEPFVLEGLTLSGAGIDATARAFIEGPDERFATRADLEVTADDFSRFAALTGLDLRGMGQIALEGTAQPFDGIFDLAIDARTTDLALGIEQADALLEGLTRVQLDVARGTQGITVRRIDIAGDAVTGTGQAMLSSTGATATFQAQIDDLARVVTDLSGPAVIEAEVATDEAGVITLSTDLTAPQASATLNGTARPVEGGYDLEGATDLSVTNVRAYGNLVGQTLRGGVGADITGSFNTATGVASADVDVRTQDIGIGSAPVDRILAGLGRISANVSRSDEGQLRLDALDAVFPNLTVRGDVVTSGADTTADITARLRDVALLVSDFSGPLTADISARQTASGWVVSGDADGPAGTSARASGTVANSGTLDLDISGSAPLALANLYIAPRQINGRATFDLSVNGPPALSSVRGPVRISDARFSAPTFGQALENLGGTLTLAGGTLRVDLAAQSSAGGDLSVTGPVDLSAPFQAGLRVNLADIVLRDPNLYRTTADGSISVDGPLAGGARIAGRIDLGAAEVQVPTTGSSALGSLPEVTHLGPRTDVRATLDRAGVGVSPPSQTGTTSRGPSYGMDLEIRAPSQIFVRGRGLDAELGGSLRLGGTTSNIIPIGRFDLVRGRLSILGQRFELDEGFAQLQGDFSPFLRLVARTEAQTGTIVNIVVEGEPDDIDVRFESTPELPQDEVLAQLLFGRDLTSISPLQAVQLASAVATLAGSGNGGGVINSFRQDLDLDDLDIITDEDGNAAVRAGKYISDNVYTDVTVGAGGTSEINLNIDIDRNFTARGTVASDGETSVGIFFERDY
ncbi:translocation/assembly module TamB domain-containing protein [Pseudooctadecabacter jejudonensis]|uniref:Translocation and assembly module TamB C-terminal domain-containing protein n=1 Tax=Pseudooctadecabacter jejudonensis TaxID=1391910 RepID=A0A1Y5SM02_9RHOB|nr:translocation/assembly module TamB domain-containing protein [Pseudooctadecabacter jejudonensis]SLN43805.1 hypothetical protein PSJ8397_02258 [Pseudooctadecabacter jejudonensis]